MSLIVAESHGATAAFKDVEVRKDTEKYPKPRATRTRISRAGSVQHFDELLPGGALRAPSR
jgi:hypothetical protein